MQDDLGRPTPLVVVGVAGLACSLVSGLLALLVLGPVAGVAAFVVCSVAVAGAAWVKSGADVLRLVGGEPPRLSETGPARLANLVASVSVAVGIPEPALRVVDDPAVNALVTGVDPRRATLVVTSGLLDRLDRLALEAVIAQQLSILRAGSTRRRDLGVTVVATVGRMMPPLARPAAQGVASDPGADVTALAVTRYPPGLLCALEAAAAGPEVQANPALAPLWFVPPGSTDQLDLRLATLAELV